MASNTKVTWNKRIARDAKLAVKRGKATQKKAEKLAKNNPAIITVK